MSRKWVIWGVLLAGKRGAKGQIWGLEGRKKAAFLRAGGVVGGRGGVFGPKSGIMPEITGASKITLGVMRHVREMRKSYATVASP